MAEDTVPDAPLGEKAEEVDLNMLWSTYPQMVGKKPRMRLLKGRGKLFPDAIKILLIGEGGVGKTPLWQRYLLDIYSDAYDPTIEEEWIAEILVDNQPRIVAITDVSGLEEFKCIRSVPLSQADVVILCASKYTWSHSDEDIYSWWDEVKLTQRNIPILLAGTKFDLSEWSAAKVREAKDFIQFASVIGACGFFETSARVGTGVDALFTEAIRLGAAFKYGPDKSSRRAGQAKSSSFFSKLFKRSPKLKKTAQDDDVPDEVWLMIFSHLHRPSQLAKLAQVCRRFQRLSEHNELWKEFLLPEQLALITPENPAKAILAETHLHLYHNVWINLPVYHRYIYGN